jgi:hypothetical protein
MKSKVERAVDELLEQASPRRPASGRKLFGCVRVWPNAASSEGNPEEGGWKKLVTVPATGDFGLDAAAAVATAIVGKDRSAWEDEEWDEQFHPDNCLEFDKTPTGICFGNEDSDWYAGVSSDKAEAMSFVAKRDRYMMED